MSGPLTCSGAVISSTDSTSELSSTSCSELVPTCPLRLTGPRVIHATGQSELRRSTPIQVVLNNPATLPGSGTPGSGSGHPPLGRSRVGRGQAGDEPKDPSVVLGLEAEGDGEIPGHLGVDLFPQSSALGRQSQHPDAPVVGIGNPV